MHEFSNTEITTDMLTADAVAEERRRVVEALREWCVAQKDDAEQRGMGWMNRYDAFKEMLAKLEELSRE